ncbi:GNAT family N-acetyltransferase [Oscillatoria sp. FACHB-1407]|nr:N-acetyltransferase [Oscillatoria sp. FACHB-1407]MBD2459952.1 GNAT family N-acetyltransferase [Oscillatoria sp. FACHB-1407]
MSLADHNVRDVAELIYESAPALFDLIFATQAVCCLTALVERSHNRFSHQYIRVAVLDHQVVGVAVLVPSERLHDDADYRDVLNGWQRLWLALVRRLILRYVLRHRYPPGTLYIGSLAVAATHRSQGIGRQLLSQCIADAIAASSTLFISVDVSNTRAQKLYESLGFRVIETKAIQLLGTTIGSRILSISNQSCQLEHCS